MALLKSTPIPASRTMSELITESFPSSQLLRGRNDYTSYAVLRSKPGRADSPQSHSMSCSDKIASWNYLGIQGALVSSLLEEPIYIDRIMIGLGDLGTTSAPQTQLEEDCKRALWQRLDGIQG